MEKIFEMPQWMEFLFFLNDDDVTSLRYSELSCNDIQVAYDYRYRKV